MTKLEQLAGAVRACMEKKDDNGQVDCIYDFTEYLLKELVQFVQREEGKKLPDFTFKRCNNSQYREFLAKNGRLDLKDSTAVTCQNRYERTVAVNLEHAAQALGGPYPDSTFVVNLTLPLVEELVHLFHPNLTEEQVNPIDVALTERFLEYTLSEEQKKQMHDAVKGK